ncbi:MAG: hypothetical protein OEN23_13845 [Paracoccaceae bacterium]|nr:hypothetical protein [Paracoccaceae bacterium]
MRNSILAVAVIAVSAGLFATSASAGSNTPGIDKRERHQAGRIYHGIQDGSLSRRESGRLIRGQVRVRRAEHRAKSDGVVTKRERVRLHRGLNRQNRRIYRARHN